MIIELSAITKAMMKGSALIVLILFALAMGVVGCVDIYSPPSISGNPDLIVIDGFLNSSNGSATVRLSHSVSLDSEVLPPPEVLATVTVEMENGSSYSLQESDSGRYFLNNMSINPSARYRLYVRTSGGNEYQSDYVQIRETPEIDSLTYEPAPGGLYINVNTHDPSGNTRYYRWDYVETWEYRSPVASTYFVKNLEVVPRAYNEYTYQCWRTVNSTNINVATTERLADDVVSQFHINYIPRGDYRISSAYSPLVTQRAISADEFAFWDQLQRTTESIGGLFDPQPGQVVGNIRALNSSNVALGYFTAGNATSKRFFINRFELPEYLQFQPIVPSCEADTICVRPPYKRTCAFFTDQLSGNEYIGTAIYAMGLTPVAYTLSNRRCTDCRALGGVLDKPEFWP